MAKQDRAPLLILVAVWAAFLLVLRTEFMPGHPVRTIAWVCLVIVSLRVLASRFPRPRSRGDA